MRESEIESGGGGQQADRESLREGKEAGANVSIKVFK